MMWSLVSQLVRLWSIKSYERSFNFNCFGWLNVLSKLEIGNICFNHDALAAIVAKSLGKRINKAVAESTKIEGNLTSYLSEMIKGSKMIKIYQQENFEFDRSSKKFLKEHEYTNQNWSIVLIRATPIMECLNWYYDCRFYLLFGFYGIQW